MKNVINILKKDGWELALFCMVMACIPAVILTLV